MILINSDVEKGETGYGLGYRLTAVAAACLCLLGGLVFMRYNEKKIISRIEEEKK
jgi:GPH family glycoside/pentoside/hexuronide:cation symporter